MRLPTDGQMALHRPCLVLLLSLVPWFLLVRLPSSVILSSTLSKSLLSSAHTHTHARHTHKRHTHTLKIISGKGKVTVSLKLAVDAEVSLYNARTHTHTQIGFMGVMTRGHLA